MGWIGKIIGGTLGFAIGGPLGAIAGAAFGHAFVDQSNGLVIERESLSYHPQEQAQLTFFVATFSMLAKLSKADGNITKEEIDAINKFMLSDLHLNPESRTIATNIFNAALNSPNSFEDFAHQFYEEFYGQPQLLQLMLDVLLRVATADGQLGRNEEHLIQSAVRIFRIADSTFQNLKSHYAATSNHYYTVLGCKASDTDEQIKKQYRKLVMEYHPDRIVSKGLPEEFSKFAQEKFREIQEAYDAVKKERGLN